MSGRARGAWSLAVFCALAAPAAAEQKPDIVGVTPSSLRAGSGDLILRVSGDGFTSSSVLRWNGSERVTAVVAPDLLTAMIPGSDVAQQGEAHLTVFDPSSGTSRIFVVPVRAGPASGSATARRDNPVPVIEGFSPKAVAAGRGALVLKIHGSGFTPLSAVRWRGAPRNTRYVSATTLEARLVAEDLAQAGQGTISVRNPLPGGGVSAPRPFTIEASNKVALDRPRVHPNPWRGDEHEGQDIVFEHLALRSVIKIFTVSGAVVKTIPAADGLGQWDLTNQSGRPVDAGAYVYMITDGKRTIEGKLNVWR